MAIYHYNMQMISRSAGRNAVACAAYRSGEKLIDESTGQQKYFPRKIQPQTLILAPSNAPQWVYNRQKLWSKVEKTERRKDSQLAREMNIALPIELNPDQQKELVSEFVKDHFVNHGMIADVAIHYDHPGNPHFHVMLTTRTIDENGFGEKEREWNPGFQNKKGSSKGFVSEKNTIIQAREQWADYANKHLEKAGVQERISHLRLEDGSLKKIPTQHLGPARHAMEKRGERTEVGEKNQAIEKYNAEVISFHEAKQQLEKRRTQQDAFRNLTLQEKANLRKAENLLKKEAQYDKLNERMNQLTQWKTNVERKQKGLPEDEKLNRQMATIERQYHSMSQAKRALENEAIRGLDKMYETSVLKPYDREELRHLFDAGQKQGYVQPESIPVVIEKYHDDQKINQARRYLSHPTYREIQTALSKLQNWEKAIDRKKIRLGEGLEKAQDPKSYYQEHEAQFQAFFAEEKAFQKKNSILREANEVLEKRTRYRFIQTYPEDVRTGEMPAKQAQLILNYNQYYQRVLSLDEVKNIPHSPRFTKKERLSLYQNIQRLQNDKQTLSSLQREQSVDEGQERARDELETRIPLLEEKIRTAYSFDPDDKDQYELFIAECRYQKDSFLKRQKERTFQNPVDQILHAFEQAEREADQRAKERQQKKAKKRKKALRRGMQR